MATVPIVNGPSVQANLDQKPTYQSLSTSPAMFGAARAQAYDGLIAAGHGLENIGNVTADIALDNQKQDNARAARALDNEMSEGLRDILSNPDGGYLTQTGDTAVSNYSSVQQRIADLKAKTLAKASNQQVADMFSPAADGRALEAQNQTDRYVELQRKNANDATSAARTDNAVSDAAANWNNPQILNQSLGIAQNEALTTARRNGLTDPEVIKAMMTQASSKVLAGTIDAAMQADTASGQKIFEANKDKIDGITQAKIQQDILIKKKSDIAQQEHNLLMADRAQKKAADAAVDDLVTKMATDPTSVSTADIVNDPRLTGEGGQKVFLLNMFKSATKPEAPAASSAIATQDIARRMTLPDSDADAITSPRQVMQYFIDGEITRTDLNFALDLQKQSQTADGRSLLSASTQFTDSWKSSISQSTLLGTRDNVGDQRFGLFQAYVAKQIKAMQDQNKNPYALFDPSSKDYIATPSNMKPFLSDRTTDVNNQAKKILDPVGTMAPIPSVFGNTTALNSPDVQANPPGPSIEQQALTYAGRANGLSDDPETAKTAGLGLLQADIGSKKITPEQAAAIARQNGWKK